MKNIVGIFCLSFLLTATSWAQGGLVNNGAKLIIANTTDLRIEGGGVTNIANGEIENEGNIYLDLNWTQTGTTTSYTGNGWMWFEGTANQSMASVSPVVVPRLRVDNGSRLILNDNITVSTAVDLMNNGNIELGTNNLVLSSGATITNYDANNYIITNSTGVLQQEVSNAPVVFPVGNISYNPATLRNSGTTDDFLVRVFNQVLDRGTTGPAKSSNVVNRTWLIDEATTGGSNVDMTLQWQTADELSFDRTNCGVAHHLSGSLWDNPSSYSPATSVGTNTWTQSRSGFSSFSPFVVRDPFASLPIDLLSFDATRKDQFLVQLDWVTAAETNNKGFHVERMLDTESSFSKVAWVDGEGTTLNTTYYQIEDPNPHLGLTYYRLQQEDIDGTVSYSEIRVVNGAETTGDIRIYPIPVRNELQVSFSNWVKEETDVSIHIIDVLGRIVYTQETTIQPSTLLPITAVEDLLPGNYFLTVFTANGLSSSQKFIRADN